MTGRWNTSVAELLTARAGDHATALTWTGGDGVGRRVSWAEHVRRSAVRAAWLAERLPAEGEGPRHVGVLMENVPEFSFLLGAAALGGFTLVGLNPTRGAAEVVRDVGHTDCALVLTESPFVDMVRDCGVPVVNIDSTEQWSGLLRKGFGSRVELQDKHGGESREREPEHERGHEPEHKPEYEREREPEHKPEYEREHKAEYEREREPEHERGRGPEYEPEYEREKPSDLPFMLILTSGTTSAPKAVICSQGKIATQGASLAEQRGLTKDDVLYCAMPLFHSNAVIACWVPAVATGATLALRRRFSASGFLPDVRRFGATYANYVGKPLAYILATPEKPDDADSTLRQVFGNEAAPADVERFGKRFGCLVTDGFGSTEGGISFYRLPSTPPGALGVPVGDVRIVDPDSGEERGVGEVGEMVNFAGAGAFEGYYKHREADEAKLRDGRFWSGDLAYRDADGNFYFAGRSGDWIRVGGENFASGPIARAVEEWEPVVAAAAYGVPDAASGDQVMVAVELKDGIGGFDPVAFEAYLGSRSELAKLWWPRYVRLVGSMPRTATNKVVVRTLAEQAWCTPDSVYLRDGSGYRPMTETDRADLVREFVGHGRAAPRGR